MIVMKARLLVVFVFVLAACTSRSAPVASVVSPTPSSSADSTPVASTSPSQTGPRLSCRLPVTWYVPNGQGATYKAGFVTFPGQTLAEDPSAPPHSTFYDRGFSKWLPVWRANVSPDGKRYAYGEGNPYTDAGGKLHVVDVASGVDRVIYSGGTLYGVIDFAAEGIYVTRAVPEGNPRGLWLEDPAGGQPRLISETIVAPAVGGGAAWGLDFNTADPSPAPGGLEGPNNRLLRFDLHTGAASTWFYRPGANIYVTGFDAGGNPFVRAGVGFDSELWLIKSSTEATKLFAGTDDSSPSQLAAVDRHGVWFAGQTGSAATIWLYSAGSIQQVATVDQKYLAIAGGCIP